MGIEVWIVIRWWLTLLFFGMAAFPLTRKLFGGTKEASAVLAESDTERKKKEQQKDKDGFATRSLGEGWPASNALRSNAGWWDQGYLFSKAVGMAVAGWIVYILGMLHLVPFSVVSVVIALLLTFALGLSFIVRIRRVRVKTSDTDEYMTFAFRLPQGGIAVPWKTIIWTEVLFFAALLLWSWIKAHEPSLRGLEKFMDYGFMNSILNSRYFPPGDMWYPPYPINYYYFGHLVTAALTKLSGLDLGYTFNLMLATIFALCFTMSFSIAVELLRRLVHRGNRGYQGYWGRIGLAAGGVFTAFLVTLGGNMQTIYAFTRGYTGEDVKPLWELLWPMAEFWAKLPEGLERYWYANATRFIPHTIHEFPAYSFVVSDIHGHVLSIPFVLLAIAVILRIFGQDTGDTTIRRYKDSKSNNGALLAVPASHYLHLVFYGFLAGILLMTNAIDGPLYFGLFAAVYVFTNVTHLTNWPNMGRHAKTLGLVLVAAALTSAPFLSHFRSFVNGIAVNCPWQAVENTKIGPLLFETVDKCQKSPFWMMYLLWGFFWFVGMWWIAGKLGGIRVIGDIGERWNTKFTRMEQVLVVFFFFSVALIIFPEFFYFKDIYPLHFRSNTMFKLGYQAFIMWSILSGYVIVREIREMRDATTGARRMSLLFFIFVIPQLFFVSIYPIFAVRSYFGGLRNYESIWGLGWLQREFPDDWNAIEWMKSQPHRIQQAGGGAGGVSPDFPWPFTQDVIVEADGDSYTDYERFSTFAGRPTVVGWAVHEWLWRGSYEVVSPRREDVRIIYESGDAQEVAALLKKYHVRYVIVGHFEREKFTNLSEEKFTELGSIAYTSGETTVYEMR